MKIKLFIILAIYSAILQAQKTDSPKVNYSNFKCYDVKYRALTLDFSGNLDANSNSKIYDYTEGMVYFVAGFHQYQNLLKKQKSINILLSDNFNFRKNKNLLFINNSYYSNDLLISYNNLTRKYFDKNQYFEIDPGMRLQESTDINYEPTRNYEYNLSVNGSVGLRYGKGRIDPVSQVFSAQFIYDDLKKEGINVDNITENQVFELACEMTKMQNLRFLDSRRRNKKQLVTLNKLLNSQLNLSDEEKYITSSVLVDNWFFAGLSTRSVGKRLSIGISPFYNFNTLNKSNYGVGISGAYEQEKPINQHFQFYQNYTLGFDVRSVENGKLVTTTLDPKYNALVGIGYYPISRTSIQSNIYISNFSYYFNSNILTQIFDDNIGFSTKIYYFLSYNTRLSLSFNYNQSLKNNYNNLHVNLGLTHAFF